MSSVSIFDSQSQPLDVTVKSSKSSEDETVFFSVYILSLSRAQNIDAAMDSVEMGRITLI